MLNFYSSYRSLSGIFLALLILVGLTSCAQPTPAGLQIGSTAPDFTLPASDGRTVSLADYQGQPVLLYFHMANG